MKTCVSLSPIYLAYLNKKTFVTPLIRDAFGKLAEMCKKLENQIQTRILGGFKFESGSEIKKVVFGFWFMWSGKMLE